MFRNLLAVSVAAVLAALLIYQRNNARTVQARLLTVERQLAVEQSGSAELREKLARVEQERERLQKDASEVHRLRGEISTLRNAQKALEQQAARAPKIAPGPAAPAADHQAFTPPAFANYSEMGKYVAGLRAKALSAGPLSPEEQQYLQSIKPELEKLERSPADFAAFQSELIQSAAGVSDQGKMEKIRTLIQRVYENAVTRNLDIPSRPADDLTWVEERFQLDRRGTTAVQKMLSEEERAAFDQKFIGIMGVDLGVGVDKKLYPEGFLGERKP